MKITKRFKRATVGVILGALLGAVLAIGIARLVPVPEMDNLDTAMIFASSMGMFGAAVGIFVDISGTNE